MRTDAGTRPRPKYDEQGNLTCHRCGVVGPPEQFHRPTIRNVCLRCRRHARRVERGVDPQDALLDPPPNGECEVCGIAVPLVLDHDHSTGRARGWLCSPCNVAVGYLADDPARCAALVRYLSRPALPPRTT